jgi:hypothetical protein
VPTVMTGMTTPRSLWLRGSSTPWTDRAPRDGGNTGAWPGLTIYRFTSPIGPSWEEIRSLSL